MSVTIRRAVALAAALLAMLLAATPVGAHAELTTADPADGSDVAGPFGGPIVLDFSEPLASNSGAELFDADGDLVAEGSIPAGEPARLVIELDEPIGPGDYRIEVTAVGDDGHIERPTVEFTVLESAPTPDPTSDPTPAATATDGPSPSPEPTPSPTAIPSPTPSGDGTPTAGTADVLLPIVVALVAIAGLGAVLLRNRRNRPT